MRQARLLLIRCMLTCVGSLLLLAAAPASAQLFNYCDKEWPSRYDVDGSCDELLRVPLRWLGHTTDVTLLLESSARALVSEAKKNELRSVVREVAAGVGAAMGRLRSVQLPESMHIVVLDDTHPDGDTVFAETMSMVGDGGSDCVIVLLRGAPRSAGANSVTLAHEMFHCAQFKTWPRKARPLEARWWTEGSAVWFADLAVPAHASEGTLDTAVTTFRSRSNEHSLVDNIYENVVFFSWLGADRLASYVSMLSNQGSPQLDGAIGALSELEYQQFAQDYVDERITTPSGRVVAGPEFGPELPLLHTTTGQPDGDGDPDYDMPEPVPPLTLKRGRIIFVPAGYHPEGDLGGNRLVFSEHAGEWGPLPNPLQVSCAEPKTMRFAAMTLAPRYLRVRPGTVTGMNRDCTCPFGTWTIPAEYRKYLTPAAPSYTMTDPGTVLFTLNADHTAEFKVSKVTMRSPQLAPRVAVAQGASAYMTYEVAWEGAWTWDARGDEIRFHYARPLTRIVKEITEKTLMGRTYTEVKTRVGDMRPRSRDIGDYFRNFKCVGDALFITGEVKHTLTQPRHVPRSVNPNNYPLEGKYKRR